MNTNLDALRRERRLYLLLSLVCVALLGVALYLQYALGKEPCPLCILQRYALVLIAIFGLAGAVSRSWRGIRIAHWLSILGALGGNIAAGYLVYVQFNPRVSCGYDAVEGFVSALPTTQWFPQLFAVQGLCEIAYPPILGLTIPTWSLIGFVVIFLALIWHRPKHGPAFT